MGAPKRHSGSVSSSQVWSHHEGGMANGFQIGACCGSGWLIVTLPTCLGIRPGTGLQGDLSQWYQALGLENVVEGHLGCDVIGGGARRSQAQIREVDHALQVCGTFSETRQTRLLGCHSAP